MALSLTTQDQQALDLLRGDFPTYAANCLKIVDKSASMVPFTLNEGQRQLEELLEGQRAAGKPRRALVLKARQLGFSTYVQGKLIHEATLNENQNTVVVAHDTKTGDKLFQIGQTMYGQLPDLAGLKPPVRSHRRGRFLHFAPPGADAWQTGNLYPNSTYFVDTAGEFESGRGGTHQLAHLSEFAFWDRPVDKLTALLQAIPDTPDSLVVIESTANGVNAFRDMWHQAEEGKSSWVPFFWAWWRDPSYERPFQNEAERIAFDHELGQGPWGEDEPALTELFLSEGYDPDTIARKLHWRRLTIADKTSGRLDKFHQEYPSSPEEAFVSSGSQVFEPKLVRGVLVECNITDPRIPDEQTPGPKVGAFDEDGEPRERMGRSGKKVLVPTQALWVPRQDTLDRDLWKVWEEPTPDGAYVIANDPSSGVEVPDPEEGRTRAFHAVQVIDHRTRKQVAEYRSRVDPDRLAELIYLAGLHYNGAWIAVEVTGGFGLPVIRRIHLDYGYPWVYFRVAHEKSTEDQSALLGWNTTKATKPLLEANMAEMLRDGSHGIRSRTLALEALTYVRDAKGRTAPEPGRYSDLLMAYMIAQQIGNELPFRGKKKKSRGYRPRDPITGY